LNPLKMKALVGHINMCEWIPKFEMHDSHSFLEIVLYVVFPIGNIHMLMKQVAILATQLLRFLSSNEHILRIYMSQSFVPYKYFFKIFNQV
jgi:hypothetical protein